MLTKLCVNRAKSLKGIPPKMSGLMKTIISFEYKKHLKFWCLTSGEKTLMFICHLMTNEDNFQTLHNEWYSLSGTCTTVVIRATTQNESQQCLDHLRDFCHQNIRRISSFLVGMPRTLQSYADQEEEQKEQFWVKYFVGLEVETLHQHHLKDRGWN